VGENSKKEGKQLSVMEMLNKSQTQLDSLSIASRATESMLRMAKYEQMNSAASIASKAFQQSSLMPSYFENQSAIARFAQSRAEEAVIFKDPSVDIMKMINPYNSLISNITQNLAKTMTELADPITELMKPLVSISQSMIVAADLYKESEFAKNIYAISKSQELNNLTLKMSNAIKQINDISELESFKALSRLDNFPSESIMPIDFNSIPDVQEDFSTTVLELDSKISEELSTVDDFNELSEERRTILLDLYRTYYYPIILNCLVILMWLQVFLDEKLDLTNNTFIFVEKSKETLSYISNVYRPNPSGVMDGLIGTAIFTLLMKVFGQ